MITRDMKYDYGKILAALPYEDFPDAILAVAEVGTFGANKYERHSWSTVENKRTRYKDAFHRHLLAIGTGEILDKESKLRHSAHAAWNALALLQMEIEDSKSDTNAT